MLRRTFATTLLRNNAGIQMVMDSLGHTDNTSVMKYLSFDEERMRLCPLSLTQYSLLLEGGAVRCQDTIVSPAVLHHLSKA